MTGPLDAVFSPTDHIINWARKNSLWPFFFGLSCCFVEEATAWGPRYDIARYGSEVFRGSPRQADVLIVSGTMFKKIAPVALRLYEQMSDPKWVISMGSCSNSGGMYDVYSVVQGSDQILPVDVYIPGCPPRPEALFDGLLLLQKKIAAGEKPTRPVLHLPGGSEGGRRDHLLDGVSKCRDTRGPGYAGIPIRGTAATEPRFYGSRADGMWTPPAPRLTLRDDQQAVAADLAAAFGEAVTPTPDAIDMPTYAVAPERITEVLAHLKRNAPTRFERLEDLTAVDETMRRTPQGHEASVVYTLTSLSSPGMVRLTCALPTRDSAIATATGVWPSASWYEREAAEMFGLRFTGHPDPRRLLTHRDWVGHPLRKDYEGRATNMPPFTEDDCRRLEPVDAREILGPRADAGDYLLNFGPHHYATHGIFRYVLAMRGERIKALGMDIGYHHRGVEKIGERQTWHQFIPYTDRVDYLSGVANNLSYVTAVETLTGIEVPPRAAYARVMLSELFRISNHLMYFGTFLQDLGMMSPIFYALRERELVLDIIETITGGRLHPSWLRIGGMAADLPEGWKEQVDAFIKIFPGRVKEYHAGVTKNPIVKARCRGVGTISAAEAIDWGVTGPNLRATGVAWDRRKKMPYGAYADFDFDVPTRDAGDCFSRYLVRMDEMLESLRIIKQAADNMPGGRWLAADARYSLPQKREALTDIESLIHHFVNVTRGPRLPVGQAYAATEAPRGEQGYYVVSDGDCHAYRMRVRTPGFANIQAMPLLAEGLRVADFVAVLASYDYILPDIDR
ncbi:NADH dehydrogenase I, D subunit [Solidesulfovibrio fructosivorans JJ]]|uniref:Multifunctional fusion protein n=1 Tax=Solidesulfovibrio fructosivorans JJ] TaxID=596151 RepID=E1JZT7_SOLFR|nr:NADH-quinone oxidoreductase subunit B/C/D [Solidesulfovibrio fructosivorans]EFL50117.1 NADH dehydrogenase I, D subunit [Solidesulfovibrio fructosivorans JJ]]